MLIETENGVFVIWSESNDANSFSLPNRRTRKRDSNYDLYNNTRSYEFLIKEVKLGGKWSRIVEFVELTTLRIGEIGQVDGRDRHAFDYITTRRPKEVFGSKVREFFITLEWQRVKQ